MLDPINPNKIPHRKINGGSFGHSDEEKVKRPAEQPHTEGKQDFQKIFEREEKHHPEQKQARPHTPERKFKEPLEDLTDRKSKDKPSLPTDTQRSSTDEQVKKPISYETKEHSRDIGEERVPHQKPQKPVRKPFNPSDRQQIRDESNPSEHTVETKLDKKTHHPARPSQDQKIERQEEQPPRPRPSHDQKIERQEEQHPHPSHDHHKTDDRVPHQPDPRSKTEPKISPYANESERKPVYRENAEFSTSTKEKDAVSSPNDNKTVPQKIKREENPEMDLSNKVSPQPMKKGINENESAETEKVGMGDTTEGKKPKPSGSKEGVVLNDQPAAEGKPVKEAGDQKTKPSDDTLVYRQPSASPKEGSQATGKSKESPFSLFGQLVSKPPSKEKTEKLLFGTETLSQNETFPGLAKEELKEFSASDKLTTRFNEEQPDLSNVNPIVQPFQSSAPQTQGPEAAKQAFSPAQVKEIVDQIVKELYILEQAGRSETVIVLQKPAILNQVQIVITSFESANKELNLSFENLTAQAKNLLDANMESLKRTLTDQGYTTQMITTTTEVIHALPGHGKSSQEDEEGGGQQRGQQGQQEEQEETEQ